MRIERRRGEVNREGKMEKGLFIHLLFLYLVYNVNKCYKDL